MTHEPYIERGSGPAVVFHHGTLMDATQFEPQMDALADRYRVISVNSRALAGPEGPHSLDDLAEDCLALLDRLGIERCVLAGMSVGGFMAIEFALRHQDRLDGLILIDAIAAPYAPEERVAYRHAFQQLDAEGMVGRAFAEWAAPYCFGKTTYAANRRLVDTWVDRWVATVPARAVWNQFNSWIDKPDRSREVASITVPTLMVHGEEDVPVPLSRALPMVDAMPDVELVRIPGSGHTSNLENAPAVNAAIRRFLGRLYPDRGP